MQSRERRARLILLRAWTVVDSESCEIGEWEVAGLAAVVSRFRVRAVLLRRAGSGRG
jgi:hypothetical protein